MLVVGAAVSGTAAARLGRRLGYRVTVYDRRPAAVHHLVAEGFGAWAGEWSPSFLDSADLVVVSPGMAERSAPVRDAILSGLPLQSELEFAARHLTGPLVAVTGTNGKTTVTSLITAMLKESGRNAVAAGNIGTALSDVVGGAWEVVVAEASSFQLRFAGSFHPAVAVLLNIAPDHLDWHGSLEAYASAKANVFRRQGPDDLLVYDADDAGTAAVVGSAAARRVPVSGSRLPESGAGPAGDALHLPGLTLPLGEIPVTDPAYLVDLVAAGVAALEAGAGPESVATVIRSFRPGPHRRTMVGTWQGVEWVDDSKATNPHAALASAAAYPSVVLIAGGRNKDLDLAPLVAARTVRAVVAIGEAADELTAAPGAPVTVAGTMEEAVAIAASLAEPGDTVLLAPGCASFDMFDSYAERGDVFATAVQAHFRSP